MPMSVVYTTFDGEVVHENRGGVSRFYVGDTNGNTIGLMDDSGNLTDTFTYWPYGELQAHVGTSVTPLQFGGILGCYTDSWGGIYMRAREFIPQLTRWLTVDPLWPGEPPYTFASSNPISKTDPSGLGQFPWMHQCVKGEPTITFAPHGGKCDLPYDQWKCNNLCQSRGYGDGKVNDAWNPSGFTFQSGGGDQCTCTCSGGENPRGCTYLQIGICIAACKTFGRTFISCVPISLRWNDVSNCRCSEK